MVSYEDVVDANFQKLSQNQPRLHTPITPALRKLRQGCEFAVGLSYKAKSAQLHQPIVYPQKVLHTDSSQLPMNEAPSIVPCLCPLPQTGQVKQVTVARGSDCI